MIRNAIAVVLAAFALTGCVVGQQLPLQTEPAARSDEGAGVRVGVRVDDQRPYVVSKDKGSDFIGLYRGGFGNPWDVTTEGNQPLARVVEKQLGEELESLGFTVATTGDRSLSVTIREWKFDGYQNTRFRYSARVTVHDAAGNELASSEVDEEEVVTGTFTGAKGGMERQIGSLFTRFIHDLVRDNPVIRAALQD